MSYICFRLEDKDNEGPFFHKNGISKFDPTIVFQDKELSAFLDISRFLEPSYVKFYQSHEYTLFKIEVSRYVYEKDGHVLFFEEDIVSKHPIHKPVLEANKS